MTDSNTQRGGNRRTMKRAARIVLAIILLSGGLLVLPRSASRVGTVDAQAQIVPTPTLPPVPIIEPSPEPSPTNGGGGGSGGGGGGSNNEGPKGGNNNESNDDTSSKDGKDGKTNKGKNKKGKRGGRPGGGAFVGGPVPSGSFSTDRLVAAAARLRALGMPTEQVVRTVYSPFIIGGQAAWTNTWGAPRFGPGPLVRTHEGQDVFCRFGDPILAPEAGTVSYSDSGLGGLVARVHTGGDSYWYLAHLSEVNNKQFPIGSTVQAGDIIGACGNSGNALTTPPHVHFGRYVNGRAVNPMNALVKWLQIAHNNVGLELDRLQTRAIEQSDRLTLARRFGDAYTSDLSTIVGLREARRDEIVTGTPSFALAEAELQKLLELEFGDFAGETADHEGHDHGAATVSTPPVGGTVPDVLERNARD